ncbi:hypothetical protein N9L19_01000 [bacterium]|nr:hypothetical protein [bacterium]
MIAHPGQAGERWRRAPVQLAEDMCQRVLFVQQQRVCDASMPTDRSRGALRFLLANNAFCNVYHHEQQRSLDSNMSLNMYSYYLFIVKSGIECAMYPHLCPITDNTNAVTSVLDRVFLNAQGIVERALLC